MLHCVQCSPDSSLVATLDPEECPTCRARVDSLIARWKQEKIPLDELCREHPGLQEEVQRRIEALHTSFNWFETPTLDHSDPPDSSASSRPQIPGLDIIEQLGQGGMGVVYKARQTALKRDVALKMLLTRGRQNANYLERFRREAEGVARLHHPHIVQIFEVGEHEGQPYLLLEFLDGGTLHQRIRESPLAPQAAAQLVALLADALQHAHERGVIHRDLKPHNILLHSNGIPRVADFGLARLEDNRDLSQTGQVMGTPSYMAPEQARGEVKAMGPATDVYGLGAILYECLTGRPPFQGPNAFETIVQVLHAEPVAPRVLQPGLPLDLDTICLKCLEKDPSRRYTSAGELAEDLRRFCRHLPIRARRAGPIERTVRWVRQHPVITALLGVVVLCVGLLLAGLRYRELAQSAEQLAAANQDLARTEQYFKTLFQIREKAAEKSLGWSWENLRLLSEAASHPRRDATELRSLALQAAGAHDLRKVAEFADIPPASLAISTDGKRLAIAGRGDSLTCSIRVYDVDSQRELARYSFSNTALAARINLLHLTSGKFAGAPSDRPLAMAFSPEGRWLAAGTRRGQLIVWDTTRPQESPAIVRELYRIQNADEGAAKKDSVEQVFFSPDGKELYACVPKVPLTTCWEVEDDWREKPNGPYRAARFACISPDGNWLAYHDEAQRILHRPTGEIERIGGHPHWVDAQILPSNEIVYTIDSHSQALNRFDRVSGHGFHVLVTDRQGRIGHQVLQPRDGGYLLTSGHDAIRFWDVATVQSHTTLPKSGSHDMVAAISPDGTLLAVGEEAQTTLYEVRRSPLFGVRALSTAPIQAMDVSPDGTSLAVHLGYTAGIWDTRENRLIRTVKAQIMHSVPSIRLPGVGNSRYDIAWHPDNDRIAWCSSWLGLAKISRSRGLQGLFSTKGIDNVDADSRMGVPEPVIVPRDRFTPVKAEKLEVEKDPLALQGQAIRLASGQAVAVKVDEVVNRGLKGGEYFVGFFVRVERRENFQTGAVLETALLTEGGESQVGETSLWHIPDGAYHFYTMGRWTGDELRQRAGERFLLRNCASAERVAAVWVTDLAAIPIGNSGATRDNAHEIGSLRYAPDGRELWGVSSYQHIRWDTDSREVRQVWDNRLATFFVGTAARLMALDVKAGQTVAMNYPGQLIRTPHDTNQREVVTNTPKETPSAMAILDQAGAVAVGYGEGLIRLMRLPDGKVITEVKAHQLGITSLAYCEPLRLLVSGSRDRSVVLWRRNNDRLEEIARIRNLPNFVRNVRLDAAGTQLYVLLDNEYGVRRWDLDRIRSLWREYGLDLWEGKNP